MNIPYNFFKSNYSDSLLEGQKSIINELEKTFIPELDNKNPTYFPTLVRMPTGTGKTGLIAIMSFFGNHNGSTLVLTPWKNLCSQLETDLANDFWKKIGMRSEDQIKYIFDTDRMLPTKLGDLLNKKQKSRCIFIGTLNGLQNLQRNHPATYDELSKKINLVVVDEGHYEPAVLWGRAVKKLNRPTLIVTATPYRNDLKLFLVPSKYVFHYEHFKAIKATKFPIRQVKLLKLKSTSSEFSKLILEFVETWKGGLKNELPVKNPRAIICCENKRLIMEALTIVFQAGLSCKAFHERVEEEDFKGKPELKERFVKNVPQAKESSEEIWIHQNKLTEGLDDPRFSALLLTYPFTNDRKLVQQVGRVLRHSNDLPEGSNNEQKAVIAFCSDYDFNEVWENYLNYEKLLELTTGEHYRKVVINYLALQPEYEYFGKKFRKRLNPFPKITTNHLENNNKIPEKEETNVSIISNKWGEEAWNTILTPPSVLVLKIKEPLDMDDFIESSTTGLSLRDAVILGPNETENPIVYDQPRKIILWLYANIKNSDILLKRAAYEISIEARFVHQVRNYLFIGDTSGVSIEDYLNTFAVSCTYFDLAKCLNENYIIKQASLFNTQSLNTAVRRTIRQGISLEDAPYQISEKNLYVKICVQK